MSPPRFVPLALALLLATSAGCGPITINVADPVPKDTKSPGVRATPSVPVASPTPSAAPSDDGAVTVKPPVRASMGPVDATKTGQISGFVYGESGKSQPIPLAFVSTGDVSAFTGNPDATTVIAFEAEFQDPADATRRISVQHDFADGRGLVDTERVLRKNPAKAGPDELDIEDGSERELALLRLKYVYLRRGEFFLEGVPAGAATLQASFGNVASPGTPITVYDGNTVTDVVVSLALPEPMIREDGIAPHIVEWTGLKPETGIAIKVVTRQSTVDGTSQVETTLSYTPDPPDVAVTLKAPPGSAGAVIEAVDLTYVYNTPVRQGSNQPPIQIGPIRVPISRVVVAAAQELAFGPPAVVVVPVGSATVKTIFAAATAEDQPGLVVVNMQFIDDQGLPIQDKAFQNLQVSAVLRAL